MPPIDDGKKPCCKTWREQRYHKQEIDPRTHTQACGDLTYEKTNTAPHSHRRILLQRQGHAAVRGLKVKLSSLIGRAVEAGS